MQIFSDLIHWQIDFCFYVLFLLLINYWIISLSEYANSNRLEQDHPCVIELIRRHFLREPAPLDVPLNLKFPDRKNPSVAQSQAVLKLLGNLVCKNK